MNIACDARALVGPLTGVGRWTEQVMGGLARGGDRRILLAASRSLDLPPLLEVENVEILPPPRLPIPGTLWLHSALPASLERSGADVFVASLAVAPRRCPVPVVLVVHDLTPRSHAARHTLANRFCFNAYLEESLDVADAVVVVSAATGAELVATFPWVSPKVVHIGNGADAFFEAAAAGDSGAEIRARFSDDRSYVLHLGTLEPRKGLLDLVTAWEMIAEEMEDGPDLVLAGKPGWDSASLEKRIAESPFRARIHRPGYVNRIDARALLQHAACFVLASEAEGFGLPLAEAIACAVPCVASDIPSLRETAGDAALFFRAHDSKSLAAAVVRAHDPGVAADLRRRAALRAPQLRWEPVVEAWNALLEGVVESRC